MTLLEKTMDAVKEAMKARRRDEVTTLRMLSAALQGAAKDARRDLTEDEEMDILLRQLRQRDESIEIYRKAGDEERAAAEEAEAELLKRFLPAPLTEEEAEQKIIALLSEAGLSGKASMGRAMGLVMPALKGKFPPGSVQPIVMRALEKAE